jgi:predicted Zn-dependent protease
VQIQPYDIGYLLLAKALQQTGRTQEAQAATAEAQRLSRNFPGAERSVNALFGQQNVEKTSNGIR